MLRPRFALMVAFLVGCGAARVHGEQQHPAMTFPAKREGTQPALPDDPKAPPRAPDPQPVIARDHWQLDLSYVKGEIRVRQAKPVQFPEPREGTRRSGRFELELWQNDTLRERLRFDFPLVGTDAPSQGDERPLRREPLFAPGAEVGARLSVPAIADITHAQVVDRTNGDSTFLIWPPAASAPTAGGGANAGSAHAGSGNAGGSSGAATAGADSGGVGGGR